MLRRFGAWMYHYRRGFPAAILIAGVLALTLNADGGFRGVEMAFWQDQACGTLYVVKGLVTLGSPQAATDCFLQAYTHCRAATLVEMFAGGITAVKTTYAIEPVVFVGGPHPCSIQVNIVADLGARPSDNDWVECAGGMEQRADGLHFSGCGRFGSFVVSSP